MNLVWVVLRKEYSYGLDRISSKDVVSSNMVFYGVDALGSVGALLSPSGTAIGYGSYEVFGATRGSAGVDRFGFAGEND